MGGSQTASSKSLGIPWSRRTAAARSAPRSWRRTRSANIVDPLEMGAVRGRELGWRGQAVVDHDADVRKLFAEVVDATRRRGRRRLVPADRLDETGRKLHAAHAAHKTVLCIAPTQWRRTGWCAPSARGRSRTFPALAWFEGDARWRGRCVMARISYVKRKV